MVEYLLGEGGRNITGTVLTVDRLTAAAKLEEDLHCRAKRLPRKLERKAGGPRAVALRDVIKSLMVASSPFLPGRLRFRAGEDCICAAAALVGRSGTR
jgi:hypothetical protein